MVFMIMVVRSDLQCLMCSRCKVYYMYMSKPGKHADISFPYSEMRDYSFRNNNYQVDVIKLRLKRENHCKPDSFEKRACQQFIARFSLLSANFYQYLPAFTNACLPIRSKK